MTFCYDNHTQMLFKIRETGQFVAVSVNERRRIDELLYNNNQRLEEIHPDETVEFFPFVRGRDLPAESQGEYTRRHPDYMFVDLGQPGRIRLRELDNRILLAAIPY